MIVRAYNTSVSWPLKKMTQIQTGSDLSVHLSFFILFWEIVDHTKSKLITHCWSQLAQLITLEARYTLLYHFHCNFIKPSTCYSVSWKKNALNFSSVVPALEHKCHLCKSSPSERKTEVLSCASCWFSTCMITLLYTGHTLLQRHKFLPKNGVAVLYPNFQMKTLLKNYGIPKIFILHGGTEEWVRPLC